MFVKFSVRLVELVLWFEPKRPKCLLLQSSLLKLLHRIRDSIRNISMSWVPVDVFVLFLKCCVTIHLPENSGPAFGKCVILPHAPLAHHGRGNRAFSQGVHW